MSNMRACESTFRRIALDPRGPNCIFSKLVWKPLMKCTFGKREHSSDMFGKAFIVLSLSVVPLDGLVVPQGSQRLQSTGARTKSTKCPCLAMTTGVVDDKLQQLGIILPDVAPAGNYVLYRRSADTLYMSGHLPKAPDGTLTTGKVGEDVDIEQAAAAARVVAINLITTMKAAAGDLDKIRLVKITGFVRSTDGFAGQSQVLNGASDLFLEAFGREKGEHARSAVGVNALPLGVCVEIEAIAEVGP